MAIQPTTQQNFDNLSSEKMTEYKEFVKETNYLPTIESLEKRVFHHMSAEDFMRERGWV
ncbi:MAG: hypothetical protein P0S96_03580 [Simkaniaceae bacterium]|nr:hypothetical protein [Candidatus Sacchlamyda saccharinae]